MFEKLRLEEGSERTHFPTDDADGEQHARKHHDGLDHVGRHYGLQASHRSVYHGNNDQHDADGRHPARIEAEHGNQRDIDRRIDDRRHPQEAQRQEKDRRQRAHAAPQLDLKNLVSAGDVHLHVTRNHQPAHDVVRDRKRRQPDKDHRPVLDHFARIRQVAQRAEQRREERNTDHHGVHRAAAQHIILGRAVAAPRAVADPEHPEQEKHHDRPVERPEAGRRARDHTVGRRCCSKKVHSFRFSGLG